MATYILQADVDRDPSGRTLPALRSAVASDRDDVRRGAAFLLAGCLARREDGVGVASLIEHPDRGVALAALNAIVGGAVPRAHTDVVVRALIVVLDGEDVVLRKEAIWALYLLGSEGTEITSAIAGLQRALGDATTQANAAVALALALLRTQDDERAIALWDHPSGAVQMGARWGAADAYLQRGDLAALKRQFASENDNVRRGLGGFLHHARKQRRDLALAGQAFSELETEHPADALLHARIYGVTDLAARGPT